MLVYAGKREKNQEWSGSTFSKEKKILLKDLRFHELQLTSTDVMIRKAFSSVSHYRGSETKPKPHQIANYLKINE